MSIASFGRFGLAWLAAALFWTGQAAAQLTTANLISYAVEEVGPRHNDIEKAIQSFSAGNIPLTIENLKQASKNDPNLPPPEITLARMSLLTKQMNPAREALELAAKTHPQEPETYLIFGELAIGRGRITDGEFLFQKAVQLISSFKGGEKRRSNIQIRAQAGLAAVAEKREKWDEATQYLKNWVAVDTDNSNARQRYGHALFKLGKFPEAYTEFTQASKLDPDLVSADVLIAQRYEREGNRKQAVTFMERVLQDSSANQETRLARIRWLMETEQLNQAKTELDDILKNDPNSLKARIFRGILARMMNDKPAAITHLKEALYIGFGTYDPTNQLALLFADDPAQHARAIQFAEGNARLNPNNTEAAITLGWVYYKVGRQQDADQVLNTTLQGGVTMSADSSYYVAQIFYDLGRNDRAIPLLEQALDTNQIFINRHSAEELLKKIDPSIKPKPNAK